ncbi:MAG: M28 family metallopeptidase [Chitinophagaceae bacterium]
MKFLYISLFSVIMLQQSYAQNIQTIINETEVERIEKILASDEMQGRKVFTPSIDKAANFIAAEFKAAGLQTINKSTGYLQNFVMVKPKFVSVAGLANNDSIDAKNIMVITTQPTITVNEKSNYTTFSITKGSNIFAEAQRISQLQTNAIVWVDTSFSKSFGRLSFLKRQLLQSNNSIVFVLTPFVPQTYSFTAVHQITELPAANVVGILPGKTKPNEYVIFSAHYDHLGLSNKPINNDSIYNGANDDAAGTTAVIMLAKYFSAIKNNDRTLIFAAFTAEEIGGFGSQYFSKQYNPNQVMAMLNIEMIGTESKWGKNSAYITGYDKTDMGKILQANLTGTDFSFYPDPYIKEDLFYRSDNATLARLGVPAHTISTSKMDNEPNYHKLSDEIQTLDMNNMAAIIRSIALSATSIISGKDTPSRVNTKDLE